jgi:hypothetical protein
LARVPDSRPLPQSGAAPSASPSGPDRHGLRGHERGFPKSAASRGDSDDRLTPVREGGTVENVVETVRRALMRAGVALLRSATRSDAYHGRGERP